VEPKAVVEVIAFRGETTIVVPRNSFEPRGRTLCHESRTAVQLLTDATCVTATRPSRRFELNYHLVSIRAGKSGLRVWLAARSVVDSLVPVWPGPTGWSGNF